MTDLPLTRLAERTGIPQRHIVGPIAGIAIGAAVMAPRATWLGVLLLAALLGSALRLPLRRLMRPDATAIALLALAAWAMISTTWAVARSDGLEKALLLALVVAVGATTMRLASLTETSTAHALTCGLVAAMTATGLFLAVETWSGQLIVRTLLELFPSLLESGKHMLVVDGRVTMLSENEINRSVCVWTMLLVPSLALARWQLSAAAGPRAALALLLLAALVWSGTGHQSTQLAVLAALIVHALASLSLRLARMAVVMGWCILTMLVVPLSTLAYDSGLSNAPWLFNSARERIALWGYTAGKVAERPMIGGGANTTPALNKAMDSAGRGVDVRYKAIRPGRHSHNYYLQVWYELGAIGALLLLAAGLAAVAGIGRLNMALQGPALAHFTLVAAMISTSYGLWQLWLHCAIAASVVLFGLAARSHQQA